MATFTEIYYNGNEYKEMWLNGSKIWEMEKDYSQYINLQEASGQTDIYFKDYYDTPSPYWAGVFNSESYFQKAMYIILNPHIKTKYVLIKGIIKTNMNYAQLYLQGSNSPVSFSANGGEVTSDNFDSNNHYEFEAVLRVSSDTRIKFSNTRDGIGWGGYIGNVTIEPYNVSIITEYVHLTKVANYPVITSITLESTLTDTTITKGTQFTITPTITPTDYSGDELVITYDTNSLSMVDNTFTVLDTATIGQQLDITYSSKNNPSVNTTYSVTIRDSISITSIILTHTLESLTDVAIGTTFTVVPTIEPTVYDDELLVDYDTNYLSKDGDSYTVLEGASGQIVQIIYYSKHNNNVNAMLEFTVEEVIFEYPYPDADSVITYRNTSTSSQSITFEVIDDTLPYSINGTSTNSFTFPSSSETQLKFVNLKPCTKTYNVVPINIEQLRIPKLTDLSYLFQYFCYDSNYEYSWQPQYFEFNENPTNMYQMFSQCRYLTDDMMNQFIPYFPNTSNVTSMYSMFSNCLSLTSLNLSNFNTSSATTMYQMFFGCNKLTLLDVSNFDTSNVTTMSGMFWACSKLTSLDLSSFNTSQVTTMSYMFYNCPLLTSLDLSNFDTSQVTNMSSMFDSCTSLTSLGLSSFDTSKVTKYTEMFEKVSNCTIYRGYKWTLGTSSTLGSGTYLTFVYPPIKSITLESSLTDTINVSQSQFTIIPTIAPVGYLKSDLEVVYDETYMNIDNNKVILKDGCQGQTLSITYRSKENNSISDTLTFTVSQDLEIPLNIDFTQSTAPTLPGYMTVDYNGTYYFSHGTYTTNVYGLVPNNSGKDSKTAYTRYKYVAPKDGALTFTYRCYAETNYDYLTVHVDTSTSQPSYSSSTNKVLTTKGVSSYQTTDGTASVNVTSGTTYYIHIQYCKDKSGNSGYDKGCIRKIELL